MAVSYNPPPLLTDNDIFLFNEGTHTRLYEHLGAQIRADGTHFSVWAPNAVAVHVIGDFNGWDPTRHPMMPSDAGIWKAEVAEASPGNTYKFHIATRDGGQLEKADPYAVTAEVAPKTASVVWDPSYDWADSEWMEHRSDHNRHDGPISIYEVHIGSWAKKTEAESYSYRELAPLLAKYVSDLGYTHVEMMPVTEHPYYPSWGYQVTGYFAPTSRFGTPQDFMYLVDTLHQNGIGVILDWVPSHFANDQHGLGLFDGTHLYEHADPRKGWHPDWDSNIFNYGRNEVKSFLLSSAMHWLDRYHIDGLRVDGVASMLYLDYSRQEGQWIPNEYGGNENLEAIGLIQALNSACYGAHPDIVMIAEESTAWGGVSRPVDGGGLGFGYKWDMGWMHDTLKYFQEDPVHRRHHQDTLTFRMIYAWDENFVLSLSHDEVVHGKSSLVNKMPGDEWQQFANLRLLYGYMYAMPGKKLLFMGGEFGQRDEWAVDRDLTWWVLDHPNHAGTQQWTRGLNQLYRDTPALHELDHEAEGFEWIDASDAAASVLSFLRKARDGNVLLFVGNFTPVTREKYRIGVPHAGEWEVALNSDWPGFWGTGVGPQAKIHTDDTPMHGRPVSLELDLPPLGCLFLKPV
ncbi:MAG: 1,4-alpha-glucan branching protein GlgB [Acidimicrobiia bacterium]|nr:1,4-alpha-glucan branching protein GlgB [Acidimicrobiia bacterium]NNF10489.1 1,4-alpha-glucan branching protein GlgB [Acidimicrobiia bacterium]NNL68561.1 1,4-alpha-glucan branching protein GlgB [Acidimicrobiia bacterium]